MLLGNTILNFSNIILYESFKYSINNEFMFGINENYKYNENNEYYINKNNDKVIYENNLIYLNKKLKIQENEFLPNFIFSSANVLLFPKVTLLIQSLNIFKTFLNFNPGYDKLSFNKINFVDINIVLSCLIPVFYLIKKNKHKFF